MTYLYILLVPHIDKADDLDLHVFTAEEPSLVHLYIISARCGYVVRPLDFSGAELAQGWKLIGQPK